MCSPAINPGDYVRVECVSREGTRFVVFGYLLDCHDKEVIAVKDDHRRYDIDLLCVESIRHAE